MKRINTGIKKDKNATRNKIPLRCPRGQYLKDYFLSVSDIFGNIHMTNIINYVNKTRRPMDPEDLDNKLELHWMMIHKPGWTRALLPSLLFSWRPSHPLTKHPLAQSTPWCYQLLLEKSPRLLVNPKQCINV